MKCKGCKHCVLVSNVDEPYLMGPFHYCARDPLSGNRIGDSRKWCKGKLREEVEALGIDRRESIQ